MKKYILLILLLTFSNSFSQNSFFGNRLNTERRISKIKESTVKVLVDNVKSGTGFFISNDGMLVTNWHVIINAKLKLDDKNRILNKFSIVTFKNDTIPVNIILNLENSTVIQEASLWDYCLLKPSMKITTNPLKLGSLKNAYEGASVYTCGFPLDLNDPLIATGILSTFATQSQNVNNNKIERKIAWLDMTTNKGNSGGALILLGNTPDDDEVIGITSFITVPYYKDLEALNQYATEVEKNGNAEIMGINFLAYLKLINNAANANSVGISGCISIEKVLALLEKIK
jgi:S1-C subfamily serine protease